MIGKFKSIKCSKMRIAMFRKFIDRLGSQKQIKYKKIMNSKKDKDQRNCKPLSRKKNQGIKINNKNKNLRK